MITESKIDGYDLYYPPRDCACGDGWTCLRHLLEQQANGEPCERCGSRGCDGMDLC